MASPSGLEKRGLDTSINHKTKTCPKTAFCGERPCRDTVLSPLIRTYEMIVLISLRFWDKF